MNKKNNNKTKGHDKLLLLTVFFNCTGSGSLGVQGPSTGRSERARAKLMYLHPHPLTGPSLNRWFLFFLADL